MKKTFSRMYGRAMLATLATVSLIAIGAAVITSVAPGLTRQAEAATTNYPPSTPVYAMPVLISGTYAATATPMKFTMPFAARLVGFTAAVRGLSGTATLDFQHNGTSLLAAPISLSTGVSEATISTPNVSDEATITFVLTISGATPQVTDISVLPTFVR